ncbi:MAG: M48 family metallopeptidase [Opitutales bacterium]|nr:M48 family metallopeptidase [Opitutales bacterium]
MSSSNFFERQDHARRATHRLVLWFALALAGTATAIYFIVRTAMNLAAYGSFTKEFFPLWEGSENVFWDPLLIVVVAAGTLIIVGGASLLKSIDFAASTGADVARQLGGREVSPGTVALDERRLINVVQEMSLASGVPVPKIFILEDEKSINAFAAGTSTDRAAVAVSRGALDKLSRDELQAVVGHEFSHILNGDMRLNIRLVGWIFGLIMISMLGQMLFRIAAISPRSRSRDNDKGSAALIFMFVGIALLVVGLVSQIFAQIIQAAISRHRERLADASATQFTRNPTALANALARIGGDSYGSRIESPRAGEFAHLFFADGVNAIFATHPPLEERIRALNPDWDGKFLPPLAQKDFQAEARRDAEITDQKTDLRKLSGGAVPFFVEQLSQNTADAKALIYMLLMTDSTAHNVEQAKILHARESLSVFKKMESLWLRVKDFPREKRISGVLLAAPALREMSARERREFCATLDALARADGNISLYEFCILNAVKGVLIFDGSQNRSARELAPDAELVLNLFLRESGCETSAHGKILAGALAEQNAFPQTLRVLDDSALTVPALEAAFQKLRAGQILTKKTLLETARAIVLADGKTTATEEDLLKAFAVALNCPQSEPL